MVYLDYDEIEAYLVGHCGLTREQAGWVSMREYILRRKGENEKERVLWERARWQMFLIMQMHPNIKEHNKPRTPEAWIRFPWEKAQDITADDAVVNDVDMEKLNALRAMFYARKK